MLDTRVIIAFCPKAAISVGCLAALEQVTTNAVFSPRQLANLGCWSHRLSFLFLFFLNLEQIRKCRELRYSCHSGKNKLHGGISKDDMNHSDQVMHAWMKEGGNEWKTKNMGKGMKYGMKMSRDRTYELILWNSLLKIQPESYHHRIPIMNMYSPIWTRIRPVHGGIYDSGTDRLT